MYPLVPPAFESGGGGNVPPTSYGGAAPVHHNSISILIVQIAYLAETRRVDDEIDWVLLRITCAGLGKNNVDISSSSSRCMGSMPVGVDRTLNLLTHSDLSSAVPS